MGSKCLLYITQAKFIQIVKPLTILPREGNAYTMEIKVKRTMAAIVTEKRYMKKYRARCPNIVNVSKI